MNLTRILSALPILLVATVLYGDVTADFLTARPVRNFVRVGYVNEAEPRLVYSLDSYDRDDQKSLTGDLTVRTDGEVSIYIANFNPLRDSFTIDSKETPSPSFEALKAFLEDLTATQKSFAPAGGGSGPGASDPVSGAAKGSADDKLTDDEKKMCAELRALITDLTEALLADELTAEELKSLIDGAAGYEGVVRAGSRFTTIATAIETNISRVKEKRAAIRSDYSTLTGGKPKKRCPSIGSDVLVDYVFASGEVAEILARKKALQTALKALATDLTKLADKDDWRGENLTDYAFTRFTPTFENDRTVSVTAIRRSLHVEDGVLTIATKDKTLREVKFVVKRDSFFVAERAVAVVWNSLEYPKYGTAKNAAGETVVERAKDDYDPINAAMMLNLVMRTPRMGSVAYPLLQIGVSTAKDFPGLLAGVGFRFTKPSAFSLSAGGMITRYKDLDGELKPGDPVEGTKDIESHLESKFSPVVLYGAIQFKF